MALQEPVNGQPKRWDKNYWLVFVDTDDAPIRVLATSEEDAKDIVQEELIEQGRGELNVGDVGLVRIVEEVKGNEEYWGPTRWAVLYLERKKG